MPVNFKDLEVWQKSMALVLRCYKVTASFPESERYGLTSQMRRAACSIPANIAEGSCRRTTPAFAHHVSIALGSHGELDTCVELAFRLGFLSSTTSHELLTSCNSVGQLLSGLHRALVRKMNS